MGRNIAIAERFESRFSDLSNSQIRRIQDTYVQRTRNDATLDYMHQAGVKYAKISTVPGACEICKPYEGRAFDVEQQYASTIKDYGKSPKAFTATLRDRSKVVFSGNWTETQKAGGALPPYHPHCRHSVIAVINPSPEDVLDVMDNKSDIEDWIKDNAIDGDINFDFVDIDDLKTIGRTLKITQDRFGLDKINDINEYVNDPVNFGYDDKKKNIHIGSMYTLPIGNLRRLPQNEYVAQLYGNPLKGAITHEIGHHFDFAYQSDFDKLYETDDALIKYATSERSFANRLESVAEAFSLYNIGEDIHPDLYKVFEQNDRS